ncbi:spore germination protein [Bacillus kwashiorkori]|uniref:spore germination protein n=1 Tax=Bacillus kwashiorkori TaxID=1522318 RepID=UPI000780FBD1|nr:spore germination protein [Bacillus kwashiorkori]
MQITINLYYLKINSVSGNGSVTVGEATHNSHTANSKSQGVNSSFGDLAPAEGMMENIYIDPDVNDQSDLGNIDSTNVASPWSLPLGDI